MSDETIETGRAKAGDRWPSAEDAFAEGLRIRSEMWGAEGTNAQIDGATDFSWPLQDTVTRWCFGETWSRDELDPTTRSLLTLGVLMAIGQYEQIKIHTRGAIANGATPEQIREVLMHTMVYVGVPRAVDAFNAARTTLLDMGYDV
jgi:4-carboxymuconolactone decarboxylase